MAISPEQVQEQLYQGLWVVAPTGAVRLPVSFMLPPAVAGHGQVWWTTSPELACACGAC